MTSEREAYVYLQLPGTLDTVPTALLKVQTLPDGTQIGRFRYGDRYLQRAEAVALDPYRLPLDQTVHEFTQCAARREPGRLGAAGHRVQARTRYGRFA
jgi:serine/threonine-protein kinase HipA